MPKDKHQIHPINDNVLAEILPYEELVRLELEVEKTESGLYVTSDLDITKGSSKTKAYKVIHAGNSVHPMIKDGSVIFIAKDWLCDSVYGYGKEYKIVNLKDISAVLAK